MKFTLKETSLDAKNNVTINGVYKDDAGKQVGGEVAFQFDVNEVDTSSKEKFLAEIKKRVEARQPALSAEEQAKLTLATTAKTLLYTYVNKDITLEAPVTE